MQFEGCTTRTVSKETISCISNKQSVDQLLKEKAIKQKQKAETARLYIHTYTVSRFYPSDFVLCQPANLLSADLHITITKYSGHISGVSVGSTIKNSTYRQARLFRSNDK